MLAIWLRPIRTVDDDDPGEFVDAATVVAGHPGAPDSDVDGGAEHLAVEEAIKAIQKHLDKEARNRWVEHLEVEALCPRQKSDLVAELSRLFR